MKEIIKKISEDINNKIRDLSDKTKMYFAGINISSEVSTPAFDRPKSTPPIAYILYGIAGLSALGGFCFTNTIARVLCFGTAAASGYGGWKLGQQNSSSTISDSSRVNINTLKNDVATKVLDSVKRIKSDWESFMETRQNELQTFIQNSNVDAEIKDSMMSKIFVYEVLDVNMSDFNKKMRDINDVAMLRSAVDSFKLKVVQAIECAAQKQIAKYNSLVM